VELELKSVMVWERELVEKLVVQLDLGSAMELEHA